MIMHTSLNQTIMFMVSHMKNMTFEDATSRCWLEVDLDAVRENYHSACSMVQPGVRIIPVLKANAYGMNAVEIAKTLMGRLENNYEKDLRLGFTTVGPHRDDLDVTIGGVDAKAYASQGQTRTAALALKLSEVQIFKTISGECPILVLDDVMSELDLPRRKKLLKCIEGVQTILTCTHAERVLYGADCNKIRIENGNIKG